MAEKPTARITPTPMPAFAPVLREAFDEWAGSGVDVGDDVEVATGGGAEVLKRSRRLGLV